MCERPSGPRLRPAAEALGFAGGQAAVGFTLANQSFLNRAIHSLNFPLNGESSHIIQNYSSALSNSHCRAIESALMYMLQARFIVGITVWQIILLNGA